MKQLWNAIDRMNQRAEAKYRIALLLTGLLYGLIGLLFWILFQIRAFSTGADLFCFIGYPVVFSGLFTFLYSSRHHFHDGTYRS